MLLDAQKVKDAMASAELFSTADAFEYGVPALRHLMVLRELVVQQLEVIKLLRWFEPAYNREKADALLKLLEEADVT